MAKQSCSRDQEKLIGVSLVSKGVQNLIARMEILPHVLNTKSGEEKPKNKKTKDFEREINLPRLDNTQSIDV